MKVRSMDSKKLEKNKKDTGNDEVKNNSMRIKIILSIILVLSIIFAIIVISYEVKTERTVEENQNERLFKYNKTKKIDENDLTSNQKQFIGVDDSVDDYDEEYLEEYNKKYEETVQKLIEKQIKKEGNKKQTDDYKKYKELPKEQKKELDVIPMKEEVPEEKIEEIKKDIPINDNLPAKFDLRDKIKINVENQKDTGLSWIYASLKSVETYVALNENKNYDFSEAHVDYIVSNKLYDEERQIHEGGNFEKFEEYLKLTGPVLESSLENKEYEKKEYQNFIDMEPIVNVTKTVFFPMSPAYVNNSSQDEINEFRDLVKNHIMKNGSLYTKIYNIDSSSVYVSDDEASDMFDKGFQAVSIIGWDDNYSKDNFGSGENKPKNDGAYIALNSKGDKWGNDGYLYISYEDVSVEKELSGIISTANDNYIRIGSLSSEKIKKFVYEKYGHLINIIDGEECINSLVFNKSIMDLSNRELTNEDLIDLAKLLNISSSYELNLSNNNLTDINALEQIENKNATKIDLSKNQISDFSVLGEFTNLDVLNLSNNNISNIPDISKLINLISLDLSYNNISDISPLEKSKTILDLNLDNNNISEIDFILNMYSLNLSNNPLNWDEELFDQSNLLSLQIANTNLTDIKYIKGLKNIISLDISNNNVNDIGGITRYFDDLLYLNISGNKIKDFNNEYFVKDGVSIYANNCGIDDISIINEINANTISLNGNHIKDISNFNNDKVKTLYLANNEIKDISNFDSKNISYIDLSTNPDIKGLESIKNVATVVLSNNNLSNLDEVVNLTNTTNLDLSNNNLKNLSELGDLPNLFSLSIENNKDVDISGIPNRLETLNIKNCNISDKLDLSKYNNLFLLNISGNNDNILNFDNISNTRKMNIIAKDNTFSLEDVEKLNSNNIILKDNLVKIPYDNENKTIQVPLDSWLYKELLSNIINKKLVAQDLRLNKNIKEFKIAGESPVIYTDNTKISMERSSK